MAKIIELEIQGVRLPLGKVSVSVTKQVNNIGELKDRQATFTNKFNVPDTPIAIKLFEGLGLIGNLSRKPYQILKSVLIYNGVPVLVDGNAYISGDNINGFQVTIYDGNIFLFQEIGNKALNELDYSDLNHTLNATTFEDSFANTEGYIYGISNNGQFTPGVGEGIQINYQIPSIFISTIWEKIFNETSFDYSGDVFQSQKFKDLVLTMKRGYNYEFDAIENPVQIHKTGIDDNIGYQVDIIEQQGDDDLKVWFARWNLFFLEDENILNDGVLNILEDSNYTMDWDLLFTNIPPTSDVTISVRKGPDGQEYIYNEEILNVNGDDLTVTGTFSFPAVAGEVYRFQVFINGQHLYIDPSGNVTNVSGTWDFVDTVSSLIDINIASFIGDMPITSFLKDTMQHFGLVMQLAQGSTTYQFKRMDSILTDVKDSYNWTEKYVGKKKGSYQLKGYAQKNRFAYSYFDDNSPKFADGFLNVNNLNLKPEATMLTRPVNALPTSKVSLNGNPITLSLYWETERDDAGAIIKYNPIDNKNHLAEIRRINETIRFGITGSIGGAFTGMVPRLNFQNLGYSQIIAENYSAFETFIDWNDVRQIDVRLTAQDVRDFDFFRLVFIEQLSSYFYVNKMSFKGLTVADAEIVRVKFQDGEPLQGVIGGISKIDVGILASKIVTLDAGGSLGDADFYYWELISGPGFTPGTVVIDNPNAQKTFGTLSASPGVWVFQLTINKGIKQSIKRFKIETFI